MFNFFSRAKQNIFAKIFWQCDKFLLFSIIFFLLIGLILVSSTSSFVALRIGLQPLYFVINHIIYMILGISILIGIFFLTQKQIIQLALLITIVSLILMFLIILVGVEIKGAKRWLYLFGFSIQPSEFMKVCFPVVFAFIYNFCSNKKYDIRIIYVSLFSYYLCVLFLLLLQPDVGMSLLISVLFVILLTLIGMSLIWLIMAGICFFAILIVSYFTFPHVNYRINTFLFEGNTYQVSKGIDAIQNGSMFGKGAGLGTIKEYVPDSHTDFIFSVLIEEFGFSLGIFIIFLYILILYRGIKYVQKTHNVFNMIVVMGGILIILLQGAIHMASNLNLIPTKGMTLPLISYGGSSLISNCFLMGMILWFSRKHVDDIDYQPLKF